MPPPPSPTAIRDKWQTLDSHNTIDPDDMLPLPSHHILTLSDFDDSDDNNDEEDDNVIIDPVGDDDDDYTISYDNDDGLQFSLC